MKACRLVAYYRVSTEKQGESGLGLDAQKASVRAYAGHQGCDIIGEYQEVESGRKARRPELLRALAHSRASKATLVIAKLDRLTRNLSFLTRLMDAGVEFVACDYPDANRFTLHLMAAMAEEEARVISERTKAALAAYKANKRVPRRLREEYPNGVPAELVEATAGKLGASLTNCRNLTQEDRILAGRRGGAISKAEADEFVRWIGPRIREMRASGATLQSIADQLNAEGLPTRRNRRWTHVQVLNVLRRPIPA